MDCPLCGERLSEGRPRYYLTLNDVDGGSEEGKREARICERCWERYRKELF